MTVPVAGLMSLVVGRTVVFVHFRSPRSNKRIEIPERYCVVASLARFVPRSRRTINT